MSDASGIPHSLLDAARRGEEAALRSLVNRMYPKVRRWALVHLGDADDADDLTQDVMIRMIRRLDRFRAESEFESWVYSMTRNAAYDVRRSERRHRQLRAEPAARDAVAPAPAPDPAAAVGAAETHGALMDALAALPDRQREVFDLVELQGRTGAEVAILTGIAPGTVRANLFKARRSLRALMLERMPALKENR